MAYTAGMRKDRIKVLQRKDTEMGRHGRDSQGITWEPVCCLWASVDWQKGKTAMAAGALDSYGVIMVRMSYTTQVTMRSRIEWHGQVYQILPETFHADFRENTVQFHAQVALDS